LDQNKERIDTERVSFEKLMNSFDGVSDTISSSLKSQLSNIEKAEKESKTLIESVGEDSKKPPDIKPIT
jgi:archaellum component FlaC